MAWGYEILFDVEDMDRLTPLERMAEMENGERWKQESCGTRKGKMGYRTRTIKAGPRLEAEIYPIFGREAETRAREAKRNLTPEKIQKHNDEQQRRKLVRLMDANFGKGDLSLTLTYEGKAPGYERCEKDVKNFIERVRRRRKKKGLPEMKYIYAIEDVEEGRQKNTHCHIVTQGDLSREELKEIWEKRDRRRKKPEGMAGFCDIDELQPSKEGLEAIARYIYNQNPTKTGEREKKGKRKYSPSKNLKKPKTRTSDTKMTGGKVKKLSHVFATDEREARRIMETLYPGYEYIRGSAKGSDIIIDGVYIRVLMRKKEPGEFAAGAV